MLRAVRHLLGQPDQDEWGNLFVLRLEAIDPRGLQESFAGELRIESERVSMYCAGTLRLIDLG